MSQSIQETFIRNVEYSVHDAKMKLGFYESELKKITDPEKMKQGKLQLEALKSDLKNKEDYLKYVKSA